MRASRTYQNSVLPGQRIVYGPFGEVGYILKNPDHSAIASKRVQDKRLKHRERLLAEYKNAAALEREAFVQVHQEKLDIVKVRSATQRIVELGLKQADYELEQKRNVLRKRLLEEESKYKSEYTSKAQTSLERRIEGVSKRVEEIEKKHKVSDTLSAQKAYERLAMEKDEDFQEGLRLRTSKNVAESIRFQICEREKAKIQEQNDDRIWNTIYEGRVQTEKQKIEHANVQKMQKQQEWAEHLEKQIKDQKRLKINQQCLENIEEIRRKEYADRQTEVYEKRNRILKDRLLLQAQIRQQQVIQNKLISERNKQEEIDLERILIEDVQRKIQIEEAEKVDNRNQLRAELSLFKEASVQYRNAEAKQEAIAQAMMEEDRKRMEKKYLLERKKKEIERKNFAIMCAQRSKQMVVEKEVEESEKKVQDAKYNTLLDYRNEINRRLDREKALYNPIIASPRKVARQNECNIKYLEVLRQRRRLEDQEMLEQLRKSRDQLHSKLRQMMANPLPEIVSNSLHPFYSFISAQNS